MPSPRVGRLGVPALVLAAVAACGPADDARPAGATAAVPSYVAPADAPGFCTGLAAVGGLDRLPASMGALLIGTINNGLIIMGLDVSEQYMVAGAIIILAVAFGKRPGR